MIAGPFFQPPVPEHLPRYPLSAGAGASKSHPHKHVVAGNAQSGTSTILSASYPAQETLRIAPGFSLSVLWRNDTPSLPLPPSFAGTHYFPYPGGVTFVLVTLPPDAQAAPPADIDMSEAIAEAERKFPGMITAASTDKSGTHMTDTIDFGVVISARSRSRNEGRKPPGARRRRHLCAGRRTACLASALRPGVPDDSGPTRNEARIARRSRTRAWRACVRW